MAKEATKLMTKEVTKQVTKQVTKEVTKEATKQAAKFGSKKLISKGATKMVPLVGPIIGTMYCVDRLSNGQPGRALMELASGAVSIIPGIGTGASLALGKSNCYFSPNFTPKMGLVEVEK